MLPAASMNPSYLALKGSELGVPDVTVTMPTAPNTPASPSARHWAIELDGIQSEESTSWFHVFSHGFFILTLVFLLY